MGAENPFQVRVVKGLAVRLRGSGNRLQRLAVRAVKGHAMTAQILEEDPPVFLPGGEAAERPAPGVKQDIFKAPAPGAVDTETRRPPSFTRKESGTVSPAPVCVFFIGPSRSEERRVGKECR